MDEIILCIDEGIINAWGARVAQHLPCTAIPRARKASGYSVRCTNCHEVICAFGASRGAETSAWFMGIHKYLMRR
jgi:hypothetical protein